MAQGNAALIGLTVEPLTDQARKTHGIANSVDGVLITKVTPGSHAEKQNLKAGEVVVEVQTNKVRTPEQLFAELRAMTHPFVLLIISDNIGRQRLVAVGANYQPPAASRRTGSGSGAPVSPPAGDLSDLNSLD